LTPAVDTGGPAQPRPEGRDPGRARSATVSARRA